jgi:modified peptide precursor CbpA
MVKGSGGRVASAGTLFLLFLVAPTGKERFMTRPKPKPAVIAYRRSCKARGTGLSHYILMDRKAK